jgi:RNA polymerase sigma-70 factor (ECF subfamily)
MLGNIDRAEDALQDAAVVAIEKWRVNGVPDNPAAWLTTTARNKALDRIRRETARGPKEEAAMRLLSDEPTPEEMGDDVLRLLFTCCHPALNQEARVALALRTISGLSTGEIAAAFLVTEPTMGQRISRAKKKIATSRIPYRVPADHDLPERLAGVLAVIYLVFTTGHHAPAGEMDSSVELAVEAIRLGRLLTDLMPDEPEAWGLLALMVATHARSRSRRDEMGNIVLMADQDRSRWDREAIDEASGLVERILQRRAVGPYQIQAAIACLHGNADSFEETDWEQIASLYRMLEIVQPSPVVRVNRAVAEAEAGGPRAGLDILDSVTGLESWHRYWSVRAELLRRTSDLPAAKAAYRRALECGPNESDRRFLESRLSELSR